MTNRFWKSPEDGSWNDASKWSPAGVPRFFYVDAGLAIDPIDNVIFKTGSNRAYTVSGGGYRGYEGASSLEVSHDHVVFDDINLNPVSSYPEQPGELLVSDHASVLFDRTSELNWGSLGFYGPLDVENASLTVRGKISNYTIQIGQRGELTISDGGQVRGSLYLHVSPGGTINIWNRGSFFAGVADDASNSVIAGKINILSAGSAASLSGSSMIAPSGTILVGAYGSLLATGLTDAGCVILESGNVRLNQIAPGGKVFGCGTLELASAASGPEPATNNGTIEVTGGTLQIGSSSSHEVVTGNGSLEVGTLSTLQIYASSQPIAFHGFGGTLALAKPNGDTGLIQGFGFGDSVDLLDQRVTSLVTTATQSNTTLSLYDEDIFVGKLNLQGHVTAADLVCYSDGKGGTYVSDLLPPISALRSAIASLVSSISAGDGVGTFREFAQSLSSNPSVLAHN